jgi:nitrogen regulatory protein P-II 1
MKLVQALIHHVRATAVVDALADAGYRNVTLQDVKGTLHAVSEGEHDYSGEGSAHMISELQLSLVCNDHEIESVTSMIRQVAQIGVAVSGWVYVSALEQALPIGGPGAPDENV